MDKEEVAKAPLLTPNTLMKELLGTSSTFSYAELNSCIFAGCNFSNSFFKDANVKMVSFYNSDFDGALIDSCSMRGVELKNCDIRGLIINGVEIDKMLASLETSGGDVKNAEPQK